MIGLLTPNDLADYLQVGEADVICWIELGELAATNLEGKWRIYPESFKQFMIQRQKETQIDILKENLLDKTRWADFLEANLRSASTIQRDVHPVGSFGDFLQDAMAERNASKESGNIVSLKGPKRN